jgi:hypothetical protein
MERSRIYLQILSESLFIFTKFLNMAMLRNFEVMLSRRLLAHLAAGFVTAFRAQLVNTGPPWRGRAATNPS